MVGENDEQKKRLLEQLAHLDSNYPGGLITYIRNAKKLLEDSKLGKLRYYVFKEMNFCQYFANHAQDCGGQGETHLKEPHHLYHMVKSLTMAA